MFKRLKIKNIFAMLLVTCLLAGGIAVLPTAVYAEPTEEPAVTEEVTEGEGGVATLEEPPVNSPAQNQAASGIVVDAAEDEEDEANPMDTILGFDVIIKQIWSKIVARLFIVLAILIAIVIGIVIYIMVTQTNKVSKQNKEMERRPSRQVGAPQASQMPAQQPQRQVKQFGDTLRIRRTVENGNAAPANMQRPVAPQRPSRPAQQGAVQPGVRRPVQGQPARRPVQGQPQRPMQPGARPVNPAARPAQPGQPVRRPVQGQPQRPVQRPVMPPQQQGNPNEQK